MQATPGKLSSASMALVSQNCSPQPGTISAECSTAAACPAIPAASSMISALVTLNKCRSGIATSPRYSSHEPPKQAQTRRPADGQRQRRGVRRGGDAEQEQRHFRPLAHHRDHHNHRQVPAMIAAPAGPPDRLPSFRPPFRGRGATSSMMCQLSMMIVKRITAVNTSWPGALEHVGQGGREHRDQAAPRHPPRSRRRPSGHGRNPLGRGEHHADNQPRLHRLAENDDQAG